MKKIIIKKNCSRAAGFSLIEILVVLAIVGIITAIALPSYQNTVLRSGRTEAKTVLLQVASNQERFYSSNNSYSTNANPLASPAVATLMSENSKYSVAVAACSTGTIDNCFVATATAQGGQTGDSCGNLTLSNTGVKGSSSGVAVDCWAQ